MIPGAVTAADPTTDPPLELPATPASITYSGGGANGTASNGDSVSLPAETPLNATITVSAANPDIAGFAFAGSAQVTLVNGSGTARFTCSAPSDTTNNITYTDVAVSVSFSVAAGELTVAAPNKEVEYNGADQWIDITVTGTTNYEIYYSTTKALSDANYTEGSLDNPKYKAAGTSTTVYYYVEYTGSGSFSDKSGSALLKIIPAVITITAKDVTVDYDGQVHGGTGYVMTGNLYGGDKIADNTVTITGSSKSAGEYTLVPAGARIVNTAGGDMMDSYRIVYASGKLIIKAIPVNLAWYTDSTFTKPYKKDSLIYTGHEQIVYAKVSNALTSDSVFITKYDTIKTNSAIPAGKYTALAKELSNTNYTLTGGKNTTFSWEIGKAPLTVAVAANNTKIIKTYDSTDAVISENLALEVLGLAEGEIATATGAWSYSDTVPGDNKTVLVKNITINYVTAKKENYSYSYFPLSTQGVINKAVLIVKADDLTFRKGQSLPELTYTITGFAPGEDESALTGTIALTTDFKADESRPGYYKISYEGSAFTSDNYDIQYEEGKLTLLNEDGSLPKEQKAMGKWVPFVIVGVVLVGGFLANLFITKAKKSGKKKKLRKKGSSKGVNQRTRRIEKIDELEQTQPEEGGEAYDPQDDYYGEEDEYYDENFTEDKDFSQEDYSDLSDDMYYDQEE